MIFKKHILFLFLIALAVRMSAQSSEWSITGMPLYGQVVRCVYSDTLNDELYVTGSITPSSSSFSSHYICKYNGTSWTYLGAFDNQVYSLAEYNGDLIAAGPFTEVNGSPMFGISRYDGSSWQPIGNFDLQPTALRVLGTDLYAMGYFDTVNGIPAQRIAKWNGSMWSDVNGFTTDFGGRIDDVIIYNGNTYVCGNFANASLGYSHMAVYKGGIWQAVGTGITGSWTDLPEMLIYNNELVVVGVILKPENVGNGIQKWNDTVWTEVGAGISGLSDEYGHPGTIVHDAVVHNNELYVTGGFGYAGHTPTYSLAKWDGLKWCGLATNGLLTNKALALDFYHDTLFLGTGQDTINTVFINRLIKYTAGSYVDTCSVEYTGIDQITNENDISIYPNPAQSELTISFDGRDTKGILFEITNTLGEVVYSEKNVSPNSNYIKRIDISALPDGLYIISLTTDNGRTIKKFIKQ